MPEPFEVTTTTRLPVAREAHVLRWASGSGVAGEDGAVAVDHAHDRRASQVALRRVALVSRRGVGEAAVGGHRREAARRERLGVLAELAPVDHGPQGAPR